MSLDRKALIQQYKQTPRPVGVGVVRNRVSGKTLVVAGVDIPSLLNRHQAQLRRLRHGNKALQDDWNSEGPDAFEFTVLDTIKPSDQPGYDPTEDLRVLEALWLEKLQPFEPAGYQRRPGGAAV